MFYIFQCQNAKFTKSKFVKFEMIWLSYCKSMPITQLRSTLLGKGGAGLDDNHGSTLLIHFMAKAISSFSTSFLIFTPTDLLLSVPHGTFSSSITFGDVPCVYNF